MKAYRVHMYL